MNTQDQIRTLEGQLNTIASVEVDRAAHSALNKTGSKIRTQIIKSVAKEVGVPQKHIRKRVYISRAQRRKPWVKLKIFTRPIAGINLIKNPQMGGFKRKIAGKRIDNAWIADGSKGYGEYIKGRGFGKTRLNKTHLLRRTTKQRNPVEIVEIPIYNKARAITYRLLNRVYLTEFT